MPFNHFYCRHLFKVFFFCSALLIGFLNANAQNSASFSGYVKEANGPVSGASVKVIGNTIGTITNDTGFFKINGLKQGNYTIRISSVGFVTQEKQIRIKNEGVITVDFILTVDSRELKEVSIAGKTISGQLRESGFSVNAIDLKTYANTTTDLNQILSRSSGVRVREQGGVGSDFNFSINGLSGKAVKYFIDGIPLEVMGSAMSLNNVPANIAESIEVYKGVVPVALGSDALGGAINVITNQHIKNYLDLSYSYGSFSTQRPALNAQYVDKNTGIVLKFNGFWNYSKNNYLMRDIEIWNPAQNAFVPTDLRRFHDTYQSKMGQVELGLTNKSWADVLFLGYSYSSYNQEIQTGTRQDIVYGDARRDGDAYNLSLRYKKDNLFFKGLNINAYVSRSNDNYIVTDTAGYKYEWDGSRTKPNISELGASKTLTNINRPKVFARVNATYSINDQHSFNLNYTLDHVTNESYNELIASADENPGKIKKQILGFAYQQDLLNKRLTNILFAKYYGMNVEQKDYTNALGDKFLGKDFFSNNGYGIASRYKITSELGVKVSYELAYRLQDVGEFFGNGYTVIANPALKPEKSYNLNVGAYFGKIVNKHRFFAEAAWFKRDASDFIYSVVYKSQASVSRFENTSNVKIDGLEGELRYNYGNILSVNINASYQNAINNTMYSPGQTSGTPEATYLSRIPNQPWFFGNADIGFGRDNLFVNGNRIQLNWGLQYTHWFYRTWATYGAVIDDIPTQYIQHVSATYSLKNGRYNVAIECNNLANALAYDNYRLQKPGRSFAVKLRYFIR